MGRYVWRVHQGVARSRGNCSVRVWPLRYSGPPLLNSFAEFRYSRCVSLFGDMLYSGGDDKTIKEWDLNEGTCMRTLHNHSKTVRCLQLRGKVMVSGSYDNTIKIWDSNYGSLAYFLLSALCLWSWPVFVFFRGALRSMHSYPHWTCGVYYFCSISRLYACDRKRG